MRYLPLPSGNFKGALAVAVIALLMCAFFAVFGSGGVMHLRKLEEQQAEAEMAAYSLALNNQKLRDHVHRLEHDDVYLEKMARERLGWIKPGELVYRTDIREPRSR